MQSKRPLNRTSRRAIVLPMVLVVIVVVSLGAYTFNEQMLAEKEATVQYARDVQSRSFALSGIEYAASKLTIRDAVGVENLYHDPTQFQQILLPSELARGQGRFSIVAPVETQSGSTGIRFGLQNESAKLNLNFLASIEPGEASNESMASYLDESSDMPPDPEAEVRMMLTGGPEELIMSATQADIILDFIDAEEPGLPRIYGREDAFNKNAPLTALDELLSLPEVSRADLYGEDLNRNGRLDAGEDTDGDGVLRLGWDAFLTVDSRESNLRFDGSPRININQSLLTELYDEIATEFEEDVAKFIVAYRMNGPVEDVGDDLSGNGNANAEDSGSFLTRLASGIAKSSSMGGGVEGAVTRGGMDLSKGASQKITSLYDLIGTQVDVEIDGSPTTLDSPWTDAAADMQQYLPELMDVFALSDEPTIPGRLNINEARYESLIGLPGMTANLANTIVTSQPIDSTGMPSADLVARRATTGWLVMDGLVSLSEMRALDQYMTARGDVFRAQSVGHFDAGGPHVRLEAVINASTMPPEIRRIVDLTDLGRAYTQSELSLGMAP